MCARLEIGSIRVYFDVPLTLCSGNRPMCLGINLHMSIQPSFFHDEEWRQIPFAIIDCIVLTVRRKQLNFTP